MAERGTIVKDKEMQALAKIGRVLDEQTPQARARIVQYLSEKYGDDDKAPSA